MKALNDLKEMLHEELEEIARKPEMGTGDLELVHKLTDTIKNIDKICLMEEEGYSEDGYGRGWMGRGNYYDGSSYGGRHRDSMGRYSRDRGRRGDYSRDAGALMEHIDRMMSEADNDRERELIRRFKSELEKI